MTYPPQQPPQQPGHPGQPPQQPGHPGQPPQQPGHSPYQGLGTYSGEPRQPRNKGRIAAIAAIVLLVLVGGGVATYFLTKGDDSGSDTSSPERSSDDTGTSTGSDDGGADPSGDASSDRDPDQGGDDSGASNSPDAVRDNYMAAYENKDFADVVDDACAAYKKKFGVDTSSLEGDLQEFEITATPDGDVEVDQDNPDTATAKIDLELVGADQTYTPKILIKIVEENGEWRFCGEDKA